MARPGRPPVLRYQDLPDILTPTEASRYLRCSPGTVRRLCQTDELPSVKWGAAWQIPKWGLLQRLGLPHQEY